MLTHQSLVKFPIDFAARNQVTDGFTYESQELAWNSGSRQLNSFCFVSLGHRVTLKIFKFNPKPQQNRRNSTFFTVKISKPWVIIKLYLWIWSRLDHEEASNLELLEQMLWIRSGFDLRQAWVWKPSKSQCFFPMRWVIPETVNFCFYNSWGYIGSSQSNSCKLSFSKFQAVL